MKESADRIARFVDDLLHGRRPHRFEATREEAEAMTAAAGLAAARVGADIPEKAALDRIHQKLSEALDESPALDRRLSRRAWLRTAGAAAAAVVVGVGLDEVVKRGHGHTDAEQRSVAAGGGGDRDSTRSCDAGIDCIVGRGGHQRRRHNQRGVGCLYASRLQAAARRHQSKAQLSLPPDRIQLVRQSALLPVESSACEPSADPIASEQGTGRALHRLSGVMRLRSCVRDDPAPKAGEGTDETRVSRLVARHALGGDSGHRGCALSCLPVSAARPETDQGESPRRAGCATHRAARGSSVTLRRAGRYRFRHGGRR